MSEHISNLHGYGVLLDLAAKTRRTRPSADVSGRSTPGEDVPLTKEELSLVLYFISQILLPHIQTRTIKNPIPIGATRDDLSTYRPILNKGRATAPVVETLINFRDRKDSLDALLASKGIKRPSDPWIDEWKKEMYDKIYSVIVEDTTKTPHDIYETYIDYHNTLDKLLGYILISDGIKLNRFLAAPLVSQVKAINLLGDYASKVGHKALAAYAASAKKKLDMGMKTLASAFGFGEVVKKLPEPSSVVPAILPPVVTPPPPVVVPPPPPPPPPVVTPPAVTTEWKSYNISIGIGGSGGIPVPRVTAIPGGTPSNATVQWRSDTGLVPSSLTTSMPVSIVGGQFVPNATVIFRKRQIPQPVTETSTEEDYIYEVVDKATGTVYWQSTQPPAISRLRGLRMPPKVITQAESVGGIMIAAGVIGILYVFSRK